jgi:surface protein
MEYMFAGTIAFNQPIGQWDVGKVIQMARMFIDAKAFNQDLNQWNVSQVKNMEAMFAYATAFNGAIGDWDVSSVERMSGMFSSATSFNQPIGKWNVSNVLNMSNMFERATAFNQDLSKWKVTRATSLNSMFSGAAAFNQNLGAWVFGKMTDFSNILSGTNLSVNNYDQTLIGWESQGLSQKDLGSVAPLKYCKAEAARAALISRGWYITGDQLDCSVGTDDVFAGEVKLFPNPTSGLVYIEGFPAGNMKLFDMAGKLLKTAPFNGRTIELSTLPPGIYLLHLYAKEGRKTWKIVKQ